MCNFFLQRYQNEILLKVGLPWLIYFILVIVYMSEYAVRGSSNLEGTDQVVEMIMRIVIIVLAFYLTCFEAIVLIRDRWGYINPTNIIDILSLCMNFYCMFHTVEDDRT